MRFPSQSIVAALLCGWVSALPIPDQTTSHLSYLPIKPRQVITVDSLPAHQPLCGPSMTVTKIADIQSNIMQAVQLQIAGQTTGKDAYPHQYQNDPTRNAGLQFTFPNCDYSGVQLFEYPIGRTQANPWTGGNNKRSGPQNPDRVIFTSDLNANTATYCGVITHEGATAPGAFIECT